MGTAASKGELTVTIDFSMFGVCRLFPTTTMAITISHSSTIDNNYWASLNRPQTFNEETFLYRPAVFLFQLKCDYLLDGYLTDFYKRSQETPLINQNV